MIEIIDYCFEEKDKLIVIASDGVWEFLTNNDIIDLVIPYYESKNLLGACECIIKESVKWWEKAYIISK